MAAPALHLLCAGAAKGLVLALQAQFERDSGVALASHFGAVGAIHDQLDAGAPCDVIVLTRSMIDTLARDGRVDSASVADVGWVHTGVAVPQGVSAPALPHAAALRALLADAHAIYLPDPERATAGIHAARVLRDLGLAEVSGRLHAYPSGAAAMAALARDGAAGAVGITQVSEILYTAGVRLLGALPAPHGLATLYSAARPGNSTQLAAATMLLSRLAGPAGAALRQQGGFEPV
jgi:molybdate transport system substrate-binding protein